MLGSQGIVVKCQPPSFFVQWIHVIELLPFSAGALFQKISATEMNSKQSEKLNYKDKVDPPSLVNIKSHLNGKETETL